jgi:CHAD domain-containing protein
MGTKHSNEAAKPQQNRLIRRAQKRLGKYASVFPMVLISGRAEYIHDIRVTSRRMQQVMNLLFPLPRTGKGRKVVRSLRKVRRALGPCRNLDVNLDLIQEKLDTAGSEIARDAWTQVRDATMERRTAEISRARDALKQTDIVEFISRVMTLVDSVDGDENVEKQLKQQTETAFNDWSDALASAQENSQGAQIHALRITG